MRELQDLVVVVVGARGGLGRPIADELRRRGAIVLGAGRSDVDIVCDLRDVDAGAAVVRGALGTQGRLDGVVNAAGIVAFGDVVDTEPVVIEELFLTNALGPLWLARAVLPTLSQTKGFFVNVSGVVAEQSLPHMVAYCASKAAASHAVPGLRREARRLGVHVVDARPPHTETGLATRPVAGRAPAFGVGLAPEVVARRIVDAIANDEPEVPSTAFS